MVMTYIRPPLVRRGEDYRKEDSTFKTYGIDVAFQNWRGEPEWHGDMIEVHADEQMRDLLLQRMQA